MTKDSPDDVLERSRNGLNACLKQLESVETTQRPENLVEMQAMSERLTARLKEIEEISLDPELKSKESCVIELKQFKTFVESIAAVSKTANLRFDSDGIRAKASSANAMVEAFLPRVLFSRYAELGEIGLPRYGQVAWHVSHFIQPENSGQGKSPNLCGTGREWQPQSTAYDFRIGRDGLFIAEPSGHGRIGVSRYLTLQSTY